MIKTILFIFIMCNYIFSHSQSKAFNMLLCVPNYNSSYIFQLRPHEYQYFPPNTINDDNVYREIFDNKNYKYKLISGSFLVFYNPELTIQEAFVKGIIINSLHPISDEIEHAQKGKANLNNYYAETFCDNYPYYIYQAINVNNIYGLHFSINLFEDDLKYYLPLYPVGMTLIPIKLYGEVSVCNYKDLWIPNWNKIDFDDPSEVELNSIPIYSISKFDSLLIFEGKKAISTKSKKYMEVCSKLRFIYTNSYIRKLKKNYNRIGHKREEYSKTIFNTSRKLKDYFYFN